MSEKLVFRVFNSNHSSLYRRLLVEILSVNQEQEKLHDAFPLTAFIMTLIFAASASSILENFSFISKKDLRQVLIPEHRLK